MDAQKKIRKRVKSSITCMENWVINKLVNVVDEYVIQVKIETLKDNFQTYCEDQGQIEDLDVDGLDNEDVSIIEDKYCQILAELQRKTATIQDFGTKKEYQAQRDSGQLPSLSEFFKILDLRCNMLESLNSKNSDTNNKTERQFSRIVQKTALHSHNSQHANASYERKCWFCNTSNHDIYSCQKFLQLSQDDKYKFLRSQSLCFNCLGGKHSVQQCMSSKSCSICAKKHNTVLHDNSQDFSSQRSYNSQTQADQRTRNSDQKHQENNSRSRTHSNSSNRNIILNQNSQKIIRNSHQSQVLNSSQIPDSEGQGSSSTSLSTRTNNTYVLLATVIVILYDQNSDPVQVKAVLDNGSQTSFITENLISKLNCQIYDKYVQFSGVSNTSSMSKKVADIIIHSTNHEYKYPITCSVLPVITNNLPSIKINLNSFNIPSDIKLADPSFNIPSKVDILIGSDGYFDALIPEIIKIRNNLPTLQNTKFGWIVGGRYSQPQFHMNKTASLFSPITTIEPNSDLNLDMMLAKFWEVEELPVKKTLSAEDELAEKHFISTYKILHNGRFQVDLPLKSPNENKNLSDSFYIAKRRFLNLEKRFTSDPLLFSQYKQFIDEYVHLGHAKYVPLLLFNFNSEIKYFLPHHCVIRDSSETTKLRVVFDASCKSSTGYSLNDVMLKRYQTQPDLYDIICRFRQHPYVFTADIKKMYRQIEINPKQRFLQNILWRDSPKKELECIELSTVTYGTNSAPFLATRTLKKVALNSQNRFCLASDALLQHTYVDDILFGCSTFSHLETSYYELNELLNSAGFQLHKWYSNSSQFRNLQSDVNNSSDYDIKLENSPNKVLGLSWNILEDVFSISLPKCSISKSISKRKALSLISQMFDPLGLIGPFIVLGKIFMQKLWMEKVSWDEPLNSSFLNEWHTFFSDIATLKNLKIPRSLFLNKTICQIQLHGFADSSIKAYAACVYFRTVYSVNSISSFLVTSKSRVAPIKILSLPRLELSVMLLLAKTTQKILEIFKGRLSFVSINLWTDSQIALCWLQSHPSKWTTFVANRVSQIQSLFCEWRWRHIKSSQNPADLLSRGVLASNLIGNKFWWQGPNILLNPSLDLLQYDTRITLTQIPDERKQTFHIISCQKNEDIFWNNLYKRFSLFNRLIHCVAYILRFMSIVKTKSGRNTSPLTVDESKAALEVIIKLIQQQFFSKEISELKIGKLVSNKNLLSLKPILNSSGFLCVGGRLQYADISEEQKHPILLPSKNHIVSLLLRYEHKRLGHAGAQTVLANVRLKYWPLNGLREIKKIIQNCVICLRFRARSSQQIMADLPKDRISICRPFDKVGIDFGGPLLIKSSKLRKAPITKCYIAIFVCMATKAIHIELVSSLSTEAFILSLKRFISRRGNPSVIYSDNATNFTGARNQLKELNEFFNNSNNLNGITSFAAKTEIRWKFIPPHSPHWGGLWEAAIKSAKGHLHRILGNAHVTFEELAIILAQIEAILNSRPLCPLSTDPSDLNCLTPGHFLIGSTLTAYPEYDVTNISENKLSIWQRCSLLQQHFWKRWSVEYLNRLQNRPKWLYPAGNLKINDLVLLKEDGVPPLKLPRGRIIEVVPGRDKKVRAIKLKTSEGILTRPITKVCPLPRM